MDSEATFPQLFRLPFVPLNEIFKFMSPREIVKISLCSTKAKYACKRCWDKSRKLGVQVVYAEGRNISIGENKKMRNIFWLPEATAFNRQCSTLKMTSENVKYFQTESGIINVYFDDSFYGITLLLVYITDLFDCQIDKLILVINRNPNDPWRFIDWVMDRQGSVKIIHLEDRNFNSTDENLKHLLDTCKTTKEMTLYITPSNTFQHTFSTDVDTFHVPNGNWITLDNLLAMNSEFIRIGMCKLSNNDVNTFLKLWMKGSMPKLKILRCWLETRDMAAITNGIKFTDVAHEMDRKYETNEEYSLKFKRSLQIQNKNGVIGSIAPYFEFGTEFLFLVWPDFDGNQFEPAVDVEEE